MNIDYSSFINSIVQQLSESNPELVSLARDSLIEIGKSSPTQMASYLIKQLTSYSTTSTVNRVEIIKVLHQIALSNFSTSLISSLTYTLVSLLTVTPPLTGEIATECVNLLNTFCEMNAVVTSFEIRTIQTNTYSIIDFFLQRVRKRDLVFFISQDNNPATPFTLIVSNLSKTADDKVRIHFCQLLIELSDLLQENKIDPKILTSNFLNVIETITVAWSKTTPMSSQSHFLNAIGAIVNCIDLSQLSSKFDKIISFYNDSLKNAATRRAAATGLSTILALIEKLRDKPKIQSSTCASSLFDFIDSEYPNIQQDGAALRAINSAVGALSSLLAVYPKAPLDFALKRIPSNASLYTLNYFCNNLGDQYAVEIATSLSSSKSITSASSDTKSLYANCFFTLIKKLGIAYEKQQMIKAEEERTKQLLAAQTENYQRQYNSTLPTIYRMDDMPYDQNRIEIPDRIPQLDDVLMKVATFISDQNDQNARDIITQFEFILKQTPEAFRYVFPKIISSMMTPSLFFSTPSLISIALCGLKFIQAHRYLIKNAKVDEMKLLSHLLMLYLCELYFPSTKSELRQIIAAVADVHTQPSSDNYIPTVQSENSLAEDLLMSIITTHDDKEYQQSLLKHTQDNIAGYINYGGEKPLFSAVHRSAFLASTAVLLGYLLQSNHNVGQMQTVRTFILTQMNPLDSIRMAAIAKFIGLTAATNPKEAVAFVRASLDVHIMNKENRLKFWKKKEQPSLSLLVCTLAVGEIVKNAPISFNEFSTLLTNFSAYLVEEKTIPDYAKMNAIECLFGRNAADPSFTVANSKQFATRCSLVIQDSTDFQSFISAINALSSCANGNPNAIERPEQIITNMLKFVTKGFKPNENIELALAIADVISKIVKAKSISNSTILINFHESIKDFLLKSNWSEYTEAMSIVVSSFNSFKDSNLIKILQIISVYFIIAINKKSSAAKNIVVKLLSLLNNTDEFDMSFNQMAQMLLDFSNDSDLQSVISSLFQTITIYSHSSLGMQANSLLRAFSLTTQCSQKLELFLQEYVKVANYAGNAIINLFAIDKEKVIDYLLNEQFGPNISTIASSLLSTEDEELKHEIVKQIIQRMKSSTYESATSILNSIKYSIPYMNNNNGELILLSLSLLNLQLNSSTHSIQQSTEQSQNDKQTLTINSNCINSIISIFSALTGKTWSQNDKKQFQSFSDGPKMISFVCQEFINKKNGETRDLFELAKSFTSEPNSEIVIAIVLGKILHDSKTSLELALEIVDFLTQDLEETETMQSTIFNRIAALSEISPDSEAAKQDSEKIINFVLKNIELATIPATNAILNVIPVLNDDQMIKSYSNILNVIETSLKNKNMLNAENSSFEILLNICESTVLANNSNAVEKLWTIYPLFLLTMMFCNDFQLIAKTLNMFNVRLTVPQMIFQQFDGAHVEESFNSFLQDNNKEILAAILINPKRFIDNFIDKCENHQDPKVRSLFAMAAMFFVDSYDQSLPEEEKQKLIDKISELRNDESELVRMAITKTLSKQLD